MSVIIPNLAPIFKENPKAGEALKKVEDYMASNVPPAPGNAVPAPPPSGSPPASTQTTSPNTGANPVVHPPPPSGTPRPSGGV